MKKLLKILLVTSLGLVLALGGAFLYYQSQLESTHRGGFLVVESGKSLRQVAQDLEKAGLIKNAKAFELYARLQKRSASIQEGEYEFKEDLDSRAILAKLLKGERKVKKFTLPEGYRYEQLARILEKEGIASYKEAMAAFKSEDYLKKLPFAAISLEGYVFPDTYYYDSRTKLDQILNRMIDRFLSQINERYQKRLTELGWTPAEWISLASIIQKESGQVDEMPLVSSVFHNRLKKGMLLQSDPTIIYGLENFDGNIRRADILNPHAFNTYQHSGLPPGPITNPGLEAMEAALFPAESDYLFFVGKGNGTHYFSKDLNKHNQAVRHYQIKGLRTPLKD
ncbi:MAG: endolytic transglycosylase MltG [Deltaproteobacteria bacterium]|nr:endolytic transglycosylase MltG [Deltaproteobacteria bacterium]